MSGENSKGDETANGKRRHNGASGRRRANNTGTVEQRGARWLARWYEYTPQGRRVRKSEMLMQTVERIRRETAADGSTREVVEYEIKRDADGRPVPVSNIQDARRELARRLEKSGALITRENEIRRYQSKLADLRGEAARIVDAMPAMKLADVFEAFAASPSRPKRSGQATMHRYEGQVARLVRWMAERHPEAVEVRQVSREIAAEFLADIGADLSGNSYNKYVSLFKLIWRVVGSEARCAINPWQDVTREHQPKCNGRRALTVEELTRVCGGLTGEMRLLFALGLYTGLRLGDCALLEWGAVDLARRIITTVPRKTAKTALAVTIPLHPALFAMLAEIPAKLRHGYLLPDTAAIYNHDNSKLSEKIRAIFEAAGIQTAREVDGYARKVTEVGFHSLRHSFVSIMGNAGVSLAVVQSIVGHGNPEMTKHYFHVQQSALAAAVGNLPTLTNGETPQGETKDGDERLAAFQAAWLALSDAERKRARKWIDKHQPSCAVYS